MSDEATTGAAGPPPEPFALEVKVNGRRRQLLVPPHHTLLEVLREELALTGTKHGCELGECGACTVLIDGQPQLSCLTLAPACQGASITTIEGMADGPELHPLQAAFADNGASQCGYCTPGMLLAGKALLDRNTRPDLDEIKAALAGNLCRCTGYHKIWEAVITAGKVIEERRDEARRAPVEGRRDE